jgi:hypothetical protein
MAPRPYFYVEHTSRLKPILDGSQIQQHLPGVRGETTLLQRRLPCLEVRQLLEAQATSLSTFWLMARTSERMKLHVVLD